MQWKQKAEEWENIWSLKEEKYGEDILDRGLNLFIYLFI